MDSLVSPEQDDYTLHVSMYPPIICEQDSTWLKIDSISGGHPNLEFYWKDFLPVARFTSVQVFILLLLMI